MCIFSLLSAIVNEPIESSFFSVNSVDSLLSNHSDFQPTLDALVSATCNGKIHRGDIHSK